MGLNPALTRKLLQRQEQKSGEKILSEQDRIALKEDQKATVAKKSASAGSPEKQVLSEAQSTLIEIKGKFPQLSQHVEGVYMKIGQIIKLMEKSNANRDMQKN